LGPERGVKSLYGGSKTAGCNGSEAYSLDRFTMREPSRSCHGEGHILAAGVRSAVGILPGYGARHVVKDWSGTGETRLRSLNVQARRFV